MGHDELFGLAVLSCWTVSCSDFDARNNGFVHLANNSLFPQDEPRSRRERLWILWSIPVHDDEP